jgi:WD40 repeat protein
VGQSIIFSPFMGKTVPSEKYLSIHHSNCGQSILAISKLPNDFLVYRCGDKTIEIQNDDTIQSIESGKDTLYLLLSFNLTQKFMSTTSNGGVFAFEERNDTFVEIVHGTLRDIFTCMAIDPLDEYIIIGNAAGELLWMATKGFTILEVRKTHDREITSISLYNNILISGSLDKRIKILTAPELRQTNAIQEKNEIYSVLNHKNQFFIVGLDTGEIKMYNFDETLLKSFKNEYWFVHSLCCFDDWIITCLGPRSSTGNHIFFINYQTGERIDLQIKEELGNTFNINCLLLENDKIYAGGSNGNIYIWKFQNLMDRKSLIKLGDIFWKSQ